MRTAAPPIKARARSIAFRVLEILLALAFFGEGCAKLTGFTSTVAEFNTVGLGQWFRYFTAICEIVGAGLLIAPRMTAFGAVLLGVVCVGAFFAQLLALHGDVIHTIVLAAILFAVAWVHRAQILQMTGRSEPVRG